MINTSRPIDVFSFLLLKDFTCHGITLPAGQIQLKRDERLDDGSVNPNIHVYHGDDFYQRPLCVVNDKFVKSLMNYIKTIQLDEGDYGDFGNEDMN